MKRVEIFADGACKGNPGAGGWGAIIRTSDATLEIFGAERQTTNNRMELTAVIEGFLRLQEPSCVVVTTDSRYVQQGMSEWLSGWMANGWRTSNGKAVKNRDLWEKLLKVVTPHNVRWCWVKGHNAHTENERADYLANLAIQRLNGSDKVE